MCVLPLVYFPVIDGDKEDSWWFFSCNHVQNSSRLFTFMLAFEAVFKLIINEKNALAVWLSIVRAEWSGMSQFILVFSLNFVDTHGNDNVMSRIFSLRFPFPQAISLIRRMGNVCSNRFRKHMIWVLALLS